MSIKKITNNKVQLIILSSGFLMFTNLINESNADTITQSNNSTSTPITKKIQLPTIHIRREETGSFESNPLKKVREMCILQINTYKNTRDRFPEIWFTEEQRIKKRQPDFNLDRGISTEPNWSSLTKNIEDEYFSGDKYALYKSRSRYKVSKDGSCGLIKTNYKSAKIDDGQFQYKINFTKRTATKNRSAVIIQKEVDEMYKGFKKTITNDPNIAIQMNTAIMGKNVGKSKQAMNIENKLTKVVGTEVVAGETCEYTALSELMNTRICYWKEMHEYPSYIKRSIILKSTVNLKKVTKSSFFGVSNNEAIIFEKNIILKTEIFTVPSNIKIRGSSK